MSQHPEWALQSRPQALQSRRPRPTVLQPRRPTVTFNPQPHTVNYYDCQQRSAMFMTREEMAIAKCQARIQKLQALRLKKINAVLQRTTQTEQQKANRKEAQALKRVQAKRLRQVAEAQRWAYWGMPPPPPKKRKRDAP